MVIPQIPNDQCKMLNDQCFPILPLLDLLAQELEELPGAFLSQGPDLKGREDGRLRLQDFSPAGRNQQSVQSPGDAEKEKRAACDLKPGVAEESKTRNHQPCDDLSFAPLGAHGHPGCGRIDQFLHRIFVTVEKEKGSVWSVDGSKAEEPPLCGKEADKFLLALPQHRAGYLGVGTHGVVLEPDTFAFPDPAPDKCAAQIEDALFAFLLKGPLGNIASSAFCPKLGDVFSQLLDSKLIHLPDNDPARPLWHAAMGPG